MTRTAVIMLAYYSLCNNDNNHCRYSSYNVNAIVSHLLTDRKQNVTARLLYARGKSQIHYKVFRFLILVPAKK